MGRWQKAGAILAAALALIVCFAALGASLPDTITTDKYVLARRGSLGANSYVVTNVFPEPPAYRLSPLADSRLLDRAVNYRVVAETNATFALPATRTMEGYARAFLVYLDITSTNGCTIVFTGASALYRTDWSSDLKFPKEKRLFSFVEITDNEYLVETRELEKME